MNIPLLLLSRLKNAKVKVTEYSTLITKYLRALKGVFTFRNDFVTSYYFNHIFFFSPIAKPEEYRTFRLSDGTKKENVIKKAWNYGIKTNWTQPNTTDVHKVKNVENLAAYMAKYLVKPLVKEDSSDACKESAKTFEGRIWYCSQSLSRLKNAKVKVTEYSTLITKYLRALKGVFTFRNDFVTSYYFKLNKLHKNVRMWLREQLISHAINCAYPFPANFQNII